MPRLKKFKVPPEGSKPSNHAPRPVTLIPGDGVGPEVIGAAVTVVDATGVKIDWQHQFAGAAGVKRYGTPAPAN